MEFAHKHPASFRDPSGFVFTYKGKVYRQVNQQVREHFELFMKNGLYDSLVSQDLLIPYQQVDANFTFQDDWYCTLLPEQLHYISYPSEWSFDMLKDAALATLKVARRAIEYGMILKDASAYNIQFHKGKMVFIDSLSFEKYDGYSAWIAYRQFCEHFLVPLATMYYLQEPKNVFSSVTIEGMPLILAKKILPWRSKLNLHHYLHIHLHATLSAKSLKKRIETRFEVKKLEQLYDSLEHAVHSCKLNVVNTTWSGYYEEAAGRDNYLEKKKEIIANWMKTLSVDSAVDIGANEGVFSAITSQNNIYTISSDADPVAINNLYNWVKKSGIENIHPLIIDITNPTPAVGFNNEERFSFFERTNCDLVMALALIHHLAIGKNVPFDLIAELFYKIARIMIIEFVPKEDEKVQELLKHKKDIYYFYSKENFEQAFLKKFAIESLQKIGSSNRILYLMKRHEV